jgi:ceramide glucosyltransferase
MTVLKPLCGDEPGLEESLRSFCVQAYPAPLQIIFGVRSAADPAHAVAERLRAEFPQQDIEIVVGDAAIGPNPKVGNLANMATVAEHPIFVISDSDTLIEPDTLRRVGAVLSDPGVGAVTCPFSGIAADPTNRYDSLGALYTNGWTLPSAIVSAGLGPLSSCDGPLTAIRRSVIEAAGGFASLSHYLGDDHELGQMTLRSGLRVESGPCVVRIRVSEGSLTHLFHHEVRWARTTRAATPLAYAASGVTWSLPLVAALLMLRPSFWALAPLAAMAALRYALVILAQVRFAGRRSKLPSLSVVLVREALCCAVWAAGFFGHQVQWRGRRHSFGAGGRIIAHMPEPLATPVAVAAEAPL